MRQDMDKMNKKDLDRFLEEKLNSPGSMDKVLEYLKMDDADFFHRLMEGADENEVEEFLKEFPEFYMYRN